MSNDKVDPSKKDPQISSADDLIKSTNKSDAELSEEELKRVSGGTTFLKIDTPTGQTTTSGFRDWIE